MRNKTCYFLPCILGALFLSPAVSVSAGIDLEMMKEYRDYFATHEISDYIQPLSAGQDVSDIVYGLECMDLNGDNKEELIVNGPGASGNKKIAVIQIIDGEAQCVFFGWGSIQGEWYNPYRGENGIVIYTGNGTDMYFDGELVWYDSDWNSHVLVKMDWETGVKEDAWDAEGKWISKEEAYDIWFDIDEECEMLSSFPLTGDIGSEIKEEELVKVLDYEIGLITGEISLVQEREDYLIPESNAKYLNTTDIEHFSLRDLCYARNEIYARLGRRFVSVELQNYFNSKEWYNGIYSPEEFPYDILNDYERANVDLMYGREYALQDGGYLLDQLPSLIYGRNDEYNAYADILYQGVWLEYNQGQDIFPASHFYAFDMNGDGIKELVVFGKNEWHEMHWKLYTYQDGTVQEIAVSENLKPGNAGHSLAIVDGRCLVDYSWKGMASYGAEWNRYVYLEDRQICSLKSLWVEYFDGRETESEYSLNGNTLDKDEFGKHIKGFNLDNEEYLSVYGDGLGREINNASIYDFAVNG